MEHRNQEIEITEIKKIIIMTLVIQRTVTVQWSDLFNMAERPIQYGGGDEPHAAPTGVT